VAVATLSHPLVPPLVEPLIDLKVDIDKFNIIEGDVIKLVVVNIAKYFLL
jgi:hypothetical protein